MIERCGWSSKGQAEGKESCRLINPIKQVTRVPRVKREHLRRHESAYIRKLCHPRSAKVADRRRRCAASVFVRLYQKSIVPEKQGYLCGHSRAEIADGCRIELHPEHVRNTECAGNAELAHLCVSGMRLSGLKQLVYESLNY